MHIFGQAERLAELVATAISLNVPDASALSFPEDDDSCLAGSNVPLLEKAATDPKAESVSAQLGALITLLKVSCCIFYVDLCV